MALATVSRSPKSCVNSLRYGVSPHPEQAPENSNNGCRNCVPRTVPKSSRARSLTGRPSKKATFAADLFCISTFVLLEQGKWFEREVDFIYRFAKPGMVALDIGANIGIYTLALASTLGASGKVFAYEPGLPPQRTTQRRIAEPDPIVSSPELCRNQTQAPRIR